MSDGPQPFAQLVAEMRHAQREYFRTRAPAAMQLAKSLEAKVDKMLREMASPQRAFEFGDATHDPA